MHMFVGFVLSHLKIEILVSKFRYFRKSIFAKGAAKYVYPIGELMFLQYIVFLCLHVIFLVDNSFTWLQRIIVFLLEVYKISVCMFRM
jgi:hypothetical protein